MQPSPRTKAGNLPSYSFKTLRSNRLWNSQLGYPVVAVTLPWMKYTAFAWFLYWAPVVLNLYRRKAQFSVTSSTANFRCAKSLATDVQSQEASLFFGFVAVTSVHW